MSDSRYLVDLWCARASSDQPGILESCCEASLCDDERVAADRFRRSTTRNQHVVGRGMARTLLAGNVVRPQAIVFDFNAHGKPDIVAPAEVKRPFNIAHTDGMVVFASCDTGMIGCDVERLSRNTDVGIARRYFATPEIDYVMSHNGDDEMRLAFLRVWTLKESFIKAIGRGLSIPLADFAFEDIDSPAPRIRILDSTLGNGQDWRFAIASPAEGYVAAVAINDSEVTRRGIGLRIREFESHLPQTTPPQTKQEA